MWGGHCSLLASAAGYISYTSWLLLPPLLSFGYIDAMLLIAHVVASFRVCLPCFYDVGKFLVFLLIRFLRLISWVVFLGLEICWVLAV